MNAKSSATRLANFVIGGTEKAGTTSVFTYLSEHPMVCGSNVKETNFLQQGWTGDPLIDAARYSEYFDRCSHLERVFMEASPGYLRNGELIASRMHALIPEVKILFILRDPVARLNSWFNFQVGKLKLPADIAFDQYVDKCIEYDADQAITDTYGIGKWQLTAIKHGCYADYLEPYFRLFPKPQIKIMFFEDFKRDNLAFMRELSGFLEVDPSFFDDYQFRPVNATFSGKVKWLHRIAIDLNNRTESMLRHRPKLKQFLVGTYKRFNQERAGYRAMSESARAKLRIYYRPSVERLEQYVDSASIPWGR
jgi:hypothetical protein